MTLAVVRLPTPARCEFCPALTSQGVTARPVGQLIPACAVHLVLALCPRLWE